MGRNMERVVGDTTLSDVQWGLFQKKVNCRKLNLAQVRRFVTSVLLEKLDVQDDLVVDFVQNMIEEAGRNDIVPKPLNALEVATNLTGFIGDDKSITFLEHLPLTLFPVTITLEGIGIQNIRMQGKVQNDAGKKVEIGKYVNRTGSGNGNDRIVRLRIGQ